MKKYTFVLLMAVLLSACNSDKNLFQQAKLATSRGNYEQALSMYSQLIKQNPQHAAALTNRALLWEMMPAKDEAEKAKNRRFAQADYERSLQINPNQPETYNNLGALHMEMNRNADAISYFSEAIARNPSYFRALLNRATAYSKMNNFTQAFIDFSSAAQLRPNDPALLFNRALAYFNFGKYEQADNDLSHAIAVQPNNARLYVERARCLAKMGYPADAYDDLTQAISLKPDYAMAYYYLGDLMYRTGDADFAIGAVKRAKELVNNYAPFYDLMGDMLVTQDLVEATANYMTALELDPQNAVKYRQKMEMMKTPQGRYRIVTNRFFPQGRGYNAQGQRRLPVQASAASRPNARMTRSR